MPANKIPQTFKLLNTTWSVNQDHDEELEDGGNQGTCSSARQEIRINSNLTPQMKKQVFYHELAHAFLIMANQVELNENEAVVELLGTMLQQFVDTKRGSLQ